MTKRKLYGFYSKEANKFYGTATYLTPSGKSVEVTHVGEDPAGSTYLWNDKESLGEVTICTRFCDLSDDYWSYRLFAPSSTVPKPRELVKPENDWTAPRLSSPSVEPVQQKVLATLALSR